MIFYRLSKKKSIVEELPGGGTEVKFNGKVFHLKGQFIRADEFGQPGKSLVVSEKLTEAADRRSA